MIVRLTLYGFSTSPLRPRKREDEGINVARRPVGTGDDGGAGRGQRVPGLARRNDDRRNVPSGGDFRCMAVLRGFKGTVLEENIARTAGSIGESVAAGAIFTLPAFVMAGSWTSFDPAHAYWKSTALMTIGSVLGVLFVSLVRRALVEDPEFCPSPSRSPRRRFTKRDNVERMRRNIFFGAWASGPWYRPWAS